MPYLRKVSQVFDHVQHDDISHLPKDPEKQGSSFGRLRNVDPILINQAQFINRGVSLNKFGESDHFGGAYTPPINKLLSINTGSTSKFTVADVYQQFPYQNSQSHSQKVRRATEPPARRSTSDKLHGKAMHGKTRLGTQI